jgi:cytoskeletal protein CcmA (bactofilin family)
MAQPKASSRDVRPAPARGNRGGEAVLGTNVRIRGRISGDTDLTILGSVEGDIAVRGDLSIGDGAHVDSEVIEAHGVSIAGEVTSNVAATGPVRLGATARVRGNLKGSEISIEDGAQFAGRIEADFELPAALGGKTR